jgi:hypothetical protein
MSVFDVKMGPALDLPQPGDWDPYFGADAPAGGAFINLVPDNLEPAVVTLDAALAPGVYNAWVKALRYLGQTDDPIKMTLDGVEVTAFPNDIDVTGNWTGPFQFTVVTPADTVSTVFDKAMGSTMFKVLMLGLVVTDSLEQIPTANDVFVTLPLDYPDEDSTVEPTGNLIPNASWECGINNGWAFDSTSRDFITADRWTDDEAHSGSYSLRLDATSNIIGRVFRTRPNRSYTFSAWVKADPSNIVGETLRLTIQNTYVPPATGGYEPQVIVTGDFSVPLDNAWHRYSVTGVLYAYPEANFQLILGAPAGVGCWIDDIQFEEGPLTTFAAQPWSLGIVFDTPGSVFCEGGNDVTLRLRNESSVHTTATVHLDIRNSHNVSVYSGDTDVTLAIGSTSETVVSVSDIPYGHYRAVARIVNYDNTREEATLCVVPEPPVGGYNAGSHIMGTTEGSLFSKRLGMIGARTLSPARTFRWGIIEATQDVFDWTLPDLQVPLMVAQGMEIMGVLGEEANPPWAEALAGSDPDEYVIQYVEFVTAVVTRYSASVSTWEIINEPNASELGALPDVYAACLKGAAQAILAIDPTARVIGFGGCGYDYAAPVITELNSIWPTWKTYVQTVSAHLYPGN